LGLSLAFKHDPAPIRRLRDIYKLVDLLSVAFMLVLVATGVLLAPSRKFCLRPR
jgi:hypothetical protein